MAVDDDSPARREELRLKKATILLGRDMRKPQPHPNETRPRKADRQPRQMQELVVALLRERDGDNCYLCRKHLGPRSACVEHIIPLTHGGTNDPSNVALACYQCNAKKGTMYVSLDVTSGAPAYHQPAVVGRWNTPTPRRP